MNIFLLDDLLRLLIFSWFAEEEQFKKTDQTTKHKSWSTKARNLKHLDVWCQVHTSSIPNQVLNQFFFTLIIICFQVSKVYHAACLCWPSFLFKFVDVDMLLTNSVFSTGKSQQCAKSNHQYDFLTRFTRLRPAKSSCCLSRGSLENGEWPAATRNL